MEKNRQWKKQVVTALELAPDLDGGETKISLTESGEAVIENYKGILQYTDSEILLQSLRGKVLLRGRNLEIVWYTSLEMKITGSIFSILLQQK
ncbi:YabP/YqfC family sporulation protein [Blautia difficilis]|uniref:YabP/YqfC family sporulation protein n=1 Tax=Blautia difficilis TaxID=2763027 RepID=UPI003D973CD1